MAVLPNEAKIHFNVLEYFEHQLQGKVASGEDESFENGLLEYPHYTRPREWEGRGLPEALLSGDHARIARWRREQAETITRERRPDLLAKGDQG